MASLVDFPFTKKSDTAISYTGWVVTGDVTVETLPGNDKVVGTNTGGGEGLAGGAGIGIGFESTLDTGDGNDTVTGTGKGESGDRGVGIVIAFDSTLDTGDGNDVVTGSTVEGLAGIRVFDDCTLTTGDGNDIVNALNGGFSGGGTVNLGAGKDVLKGFQTNNIYGTVNCFGGAGVDNILLGAGTYVISGSTITNGSSVTMNVSEFERIGGTKGNLFNFADGTLTVGANGVATFA